MTLRHSTLLATMLLASFFTASDSLDEPIMMNIAASTPPKPGFQASWHHPLTIPVRPISYFVLPKSEWGSGHRGIDFATSTGDRVVSPAGGLVSFSGLVAGKPVVTITLPGDLLVSFEPVSSDLAAGDAIERGELIGVVATGGHCQATCLHLGVRRHGAYINPLRFFVDKPRLLASDASGYARG